MSETRKETDALGVVDVPLRTYYGAFTVRALGNFQISGLVIDKEFIYSLVECARANSQVYVQATQFTNPHSYFGFSHNFSAKPKTGLRRLIEVFSS